MNYDKPFKTPVLHQLVLPTVYGEELSYYEGIRKLTYYINQFREYVDNIVNNLQDVANTYTDQQIALLRTELDGKIGSVDQKLDSAVQELNSSIDSLHTSITNLYTNFNNYTNATDSKIELEFQNLKNYVDAIASTISPVYVINPITGKSSTIQAAINDLYNFIHAVGSLRAIDYDRMGLSAQDYDAQALTAYEYDTLARFLLFKFLYLRMFSPFDGKLTFYDVVINQLANLHKNSYTVSEYDALSMSANEYDILTVTAYEFDWNSKTALGG